MKELMFSRHFLKNHPRVGESTLFMEKICRNLYEQGYPVFLYTEDSYGDSKRHTIRKGNRFNPGDHVNFKVWTGLPYRSKKLTFAIGVEIKKTWPFELTKEDFILNGKVLHLKELTMVAMNDGLTCEDFECWFNSKPFTGQVICWDEKIDYY